MGRFMIATLSPAVLLIGGALWGGIWILAAVGAITLLTFAMDRLGRAAQVHQPEAEFPSGDALSVGLALLHMPMLVLACWSIGGESLHTLPERIGLVIGYGLFFGQVAHPNAHELIHRSPRALRALGQMIYITLLIGHHVSAHRLVHHIHVATDADPSSALANESFWRFAPRGWLGAFRAGLHAESARRHKAGKKGLNPYVLYCGGATVTMLVALDLWGVTGLVALVALASYAQMQMLLSDYVQHFGLRRKILASGKAEPVGPQHSWNTPHWYSSAMMLNAPRHSDHHLNPMRPYPGLRLEQTMPILPHSLPVMAVIALWPKLWRRVMHPRLAALSPAGSGQ